MSTTNDPQCVNTENVYSALREIQHEIKAPKNQYNSFGKYNYRSKEDILEGAKESNHKHGCCLIVNDEIKETAGRVYVESTATLYHVQSGTSITAKGQAREEETKKGMDASQITGTAASYAGKRALSNLYALDDTKDADSNEQQQAQTRQQSSQRTQAPQTQQTPPQQPQAQPVRGMCTQCGTVYQFESTEQMKLCACRCGNTQFNLVEG